MTHAAKATGPLRPHPRNPRYFSDAHGNVVYLTGSHTWDNLQDWGPPTPDFDYDAYIRFLNDHHHNFIRLWLWEQSRIDTGAASDIRPLPWKRTGPGLANDGQPKFDLTQLNDDFFQRLRQRLIVARDAGIYASVMLFHEYSVSHAISWQHHPFNRDNNVNGIDADPANTGRGFEFHHRAIPAVLELQEQYLKRVIETVNDLDNVLFEVGNEMKRDSIEWQYWVIEFIHQSEAGLPKQHPVGMTTAGTGVEDPLITNQHLADSGADWISPHVEPGQDYAFDPPIADGAQVILADTDHIMGVLNTTDEDVMVNWVWKSFMRGHHPILMDTCQNGIPGHGSVPWNVYDNPAFEPGRKAMGQTLRLAESLDLSRLTPRPDLASTGYCLAGEVTTGYQLAAYLPAGGAVTIQVPPSQGNYSVEWLEPVSGETQNGTVAPSGRTLEFQSPFSQRAVLVLRPQ